MTMPTNVTPISRTVELPPPQFPMLTRMISNPLFPDEGPGPITWAVGGAHPLAPGVKVIRMFVDRGGVEIYSVSEDGRTAVRNLVPMHWVRFIEEAMPLDVFVDELADAESGDEDEDDDPEPVYGDAGSNAPELDPPANGQDAS